MPIPHISEKDKHTDFTCPNISCRKIFTHPVKALNLQVSPAEPYDACPYCLTNLAEHSTVPRKMAKSLAPDVEGFGEEAPSISEKPSAECPFHLGYLGERSSKSQIPDECLLCKDVVGCMMKKIVE